MVRLVTLGMMSDIGSGLAQLDVGCSLIRRLMAIEVQVGWVDDIRLFIFGSVVGCCHSVLGVVLWCR